jgi:hypothetical protein
MDLKICQKIQNKSWVQIVLGDDNVALTAKLQHVTNCPCNVTYMMFHWKAIKKNFMEFDSSNLLGMEVTVCCNLATR